jgi:hypothetical protein
LTQPQPQALEFNALDPHPLPWLSVLHSTMAVELVNEATLKRLKNNVIGNANAKASLAADGNLLQL